MFSQLLDSAKDILSEAASELTAPGTEPTAPPNLQSTQRTSTSTKQEDHDSTHATKISQEDIAKLSHGIDALVNFISEKVATKEVDEEKMTKVDSSGGKVQLPTTVGDEPSAQLPKHEKADILSQLMGEAKKLRDAIGEQKPYDQKDSDAGSASGETAQSNSSLSREDIAKITTTIGSLVASLTKKAQGHPDGDNEAGQHPTGQPAQDARTGGDFLSGLMSIASDLTKAIGEGNPDSHVANNKAPSSNEASQGSQQFDHQDIEKLAAGISSLVGTFRDKAADIFHKPVAGQEHNKPEELAKKQEKKPDEEPVHDDVEGE
ncbi:hypothetical protein KIN20_026194, partial [Parelaphostrongylus tenuis]